MNPRPSFEALLAARVAAVLAMAGCTGAGEETAVSCDGPLPPRFVRIEGYVAVEPDADCPEPEDAGRLQTVDCCPTYVYQGVNCGPVRKEPNLVPTGSYGSTWQPADTATAGMMDLCFYEGIFEETGACCGRPLLEEGRPVVARPSRSTAWHAPASPDLSGLTPAARRRVGEHWLRSALMEHASVASFARVTLDLMRLGAPPALLADTHRAGLDEIEHARLCFALASAALGEAVGPAAMAIPEPAALDRLGFAEALVREGCVGETLAALDAAARLRRATDPAVCQVLRAIVADESRHAALAWRTLAWLLDGDAGGAVRAHLEAVFADERTKLDADRAETGEAVPGHGLISEREALGALRDGWDRVIGPAWSGLA